jgi:hypothetical protein
MYRIICLGAIALTACGAPIPQGEVDTYCPKCYERIQNGQAFAPARAMPSGSTTAAGASR